MQDYTLPDDIRGEWIWSRDSVDKLASYVFLRRDFMLSETPASADLWVSARTLCHVYLNDRYLGFGPPPCPTENSYVMYFDVAFMCETGKNTIAVLAHNTQVARSAARRHPSGFWCQLNIDDRAEVWTDRSWHCLDAECYAPDSWRASNCTAFNEKIDLTSFPRQTTPDGLLADWYEKEFSPFHWKHVDHSVSLAEARGNLAPLASAQWNITREDVREITVRGIWGKVAASTQVSFSGLVDERGAGVYVAEAYLYSPEDATVEFMLYSDDPHCLFVNGQLCRAQGIEPLPARADLDNAGPRCFRQADVENPASEMAIHEGWNHLVLAQQVEPQSAGLTIVFPDFKPEELQLRRQEGEDAPPGWSLGGPIRTPLALVTANLDLQGLPKTPFVSEPEEPVDEAAFLASCGFDPSGDVSGPTHTITLEQGQYVILDLGASLYGCPEFTVIGQDADILDVVCGEQIIEGRLLPYVDGFRRLDTIVLGPELCRWLACEPRGARYLMLVARRALDAITVEACGLQVREFSYDNDGAFECSDSLLNQIWETGRRTLRGTMQGGFLDSAAKENAQYIADAMIQSWAGYHVLGCFELAAKGIEEFAGVQFETGEMPVLCPSDTYFNMPDYALLWPVWLQRHYMYTGDRQFLMKMLPAMENLFAYYAELAAPTDELLGDLDVRCGAYCFLDHGAIDRQGIITGLNAVYCRSLISGEWLCQEVGNQDRAQELRRVANRVARRIQALTWDEERGLFADCWHDGEMSEFYSMQTNVLAIYGGIALAANYNQIFEQLFTSEEPYELFSQADANNPYFKYFVLEAAFALEHREWALNMMRWYWGGMIERGAQTWWELFDPQSDQEEMAGVSRCHGYGVSPNGFLCTELAGVRPAKPGFTAAYFNPLPGVAQWVKVHIPTPYGRITAEWEFRGDNEFEAVIDANFPLDIVPVLAPGLSETATIHVSDNVSILAESA